MHSIMQHMDLQGDFERDGIQKQLENMVVKEMILPEHAALVDVSGILAFESLDGASLCR